MEKPSKSAGNKTSESRSKATINKIRLHKIHVKNRVKLMTENFMFNQLLDTDIKNEIAGIEPFVFVVTIKKNNSITIKAITIQGKTAQKEDIKEKDGNIVATIKAFIATSTFVLSIEATGTAFMETTFNLTCDDMKVFKEDEKIVIQSSMRGGFINDAVKIP